MSKSIAVAGLRVSAVKLFGALVMCSIHFQRIA